MSYATVRDSVRGVVAGVTGIAGVAQVYDYWRNPLDEATAKALFRDTNGRMHFWCVVPAKGDAYATTQFPGTHEQALFSFEIHAYMALADADATEKKLTDLVELVIAAFRADKKLGNTVIGCTPAQWVTHEHVIYGAVVSHHDILTLKVRVQTEP